MLIYILIIHKDKRQDIFLVFRKQENHLSFLSTSGVAEGKD